MPKRGESGRPDRYAGRRYKGVVAGGLEGEEAGGEMVLVVSEAHLEKV